MHKNFHGMRCQRDAKNKQGPSLPRGLVLLERAKRFELSTLTLARLCSTPELRPRTIREG